MMLGKLAIFFAGLAGKDIGIAGRIAAGMQKNIIRKLRKKTEAEFIFIVGTNGKTTTRHLLTDIFKKEKLNIGSNHHSKDDYYGVISAMIEKTNIFGRTKVDYMVIEIRNIATLSLFAELTPEYLILTNLFIEQLSRKGQEKKLLSDLKKYLESIPETTLIFNGDDPVVANIGMDLPNRLFYYGIDIEEDDDEPAQKTCIRCGGTLKYRDIYSGQLGSYKCLDCELEKPEIDYLATNVSLKDGIYFDLQAKGEEYPFDLPSQGYHNIYNILAALALLEELDIGIDAGELALEKIEEDDSDLDSFYIRKPIFYKATETISSFEQSLLSVDEDEGRTDILFIFDDDEDEDEITFIYELDWSVLEKHNIGKIYITGDRAYDLGLCIRYMTNAGKKLTVDTNTDMVAEQAIGGKGEKLYIIAKGQADKDPKKILSAMEKKWSRNKSWTGR